MKARHLFGLLSLTLVVIACQAPDDDIYILYDNDVHCAIEGYEKMAALRADYLKKSIYVNVVSCGDFVQGNTVGSISKGKYPVAIMNDVPYDYVTLGNHEFDYGVSQMKKIMWWMRAKCLCCNLSYIPTGKYLFPAYDIRTYGTIKVAFVGVATPTTIANSVPAYFQNNTGEMEYDFHAAETVELVQQAVNNARMEGAQRVIVLSHLGDDTRSISSLDLISKTTGIDVVLDGHAHHVIHTRLANADGDSVLLASTGSNFRYIGRLLITKNNEIENELIPLSSYEGANERIRSRVESVWEKVNKVTCRYIGFSEVDLVDSDENGNRLVRNGETNLGDFVADAMRVMSGADIGIANGGGLRSSLKAGKITYGDLVCVLPFNNTLYKVQLSGQQLYDALEISVDDYEQESGDFLHVSGIRYTIDPAIPTSVHLDEDGMCDSIGDTRRVLNVEIWKDSIWIPIEKDSLYTVGGQNYNLVCGGTSGMFQQTKSLDIDHIVDVDVLSDYIHKMGDTIRSEQYATDQQRIIILTK